MADLDKSDAVLWAVGPARHVSQCVEDVPDVTVAQAPATQMPRKQGNDREVSDWDTNHATPTTRQHTWSWSSCLVSPQEDCAPLKKIVRTEGKDRFAATSTPSCPPATHPPSRL